MTVQRPLESFVRNSTTSLSLDRRHFVLGVATGGLVALASPRLSWSGQATESPVAGSTQRQANNPFFAFIEITPEDQVRIVSPQPEIGQGIFDTLAMIVAEEMDADWDRVEVRLPHANIALANPANGRQRIGGSDSVMAFRQPLRKVGATARQMLLEAAAQTWQVEITGCQARNGRVTHLATGRSLSFGELAARAAALPVPTEVTLKSSDQLHLTGRRRVRKDTPAKVDGSAVFAVDVRLPGMLFAALRCSDTLQASVRSVNASEVERMAGVVAVVELPDAVAVVAKNWWQARRAAESLEVIFDTPAPSRVSDEAISQTLRESLSLDANALEQPSLTFESGQRKWVPADRAALSAALSREDVEQLEASYEVPYLAHMTMEPQSCVAWVNSERCELWGGLQQPDRARELAAEMTGIPVEQVRVNVTFAGGGFGRRWELDSVRQVVKLAQALPGRPINLIWTREQDTRHDFYRPAHAARYRAAIAADGTLLAVHGRVAGQSLLGYKGMRRNRTVPDASSSFGVIPAEYTIPNKLVDCVEVSTPVPVGFWRSVGASQNCFFAESFMDELASRAKRDPVEFRRQLLLSSPRMLGVLERVSKETDWGVPLPAGHGRGIALSAGFGSFCAQVVEVATQGMQVAIKKITCVYDCGIVLNPGTVEAQLEGGIVYGLAAALYGKITLDAGAVKESNFHDQRMLSLPETPQMRVILMSSTQAAGGVGEGGTPPVAPALVNAIYAATGRRYRELPLERSGLQFVDSSMINSAVT